MSLDAVTITLDGLAGRDDGGSGGYEVMEKSADSLVMVRPKTRTTFGLVQRADAEHDAATLEHAAEQFLTHRVVRDGTVLGQVVGVMTWPQAVVRKGAMIPPDSLFATVLWTPKGWSLLQAGKVPRMPLSVP